jgi:hypothetical protein
VEPAHVLATAAKAIGQLLHGNAQAIQAEPAAQIPKLSPIDGQSPAALHQLQIHGARGDAPLMGERINM